LATFSERGAGNIPTADGRIRFLLRQLQRKTDTGAAVLNVGIGGGLFEQLAIQQSASSTWK
jgi:hypothetical protein